MVPFYQVDLDLAENETRTVTRFKPRDGIPPGTYGLIESYCPDPDCDCRRVMINVVEEKNSAKYLTSIGYGFDRQAEDAGPYLDMLNDQCAYAGALMRMVEEVALSDRRYVARLERHYALVKRAAVDPAHPAYETLREATENEDGWRSVRAMQEWVDDPAPAPGPPPKRVGRNDPCPCGSGKKYKRCCMRKERRRKVKLARQGNTIGELIGRLVRSTDWPSPSLLSDILACGKEAIDPLIAIIRDPDMYWDLVQGGPRRTPEIAMGMLGDLRAQAAIPDLVKLFYWVDMDHHCLERVVNTLARIGPAVVEPVKAVALDRSLRWYPRAMAISVLVVRVYTDPEGTQELLGYLRNLLRYGPIDSPEDRIFYAMLAQDLADAQGMDALDVILAAYERDAIDEEYVDWPDAEAICRNARPDSLARRTADFLSNYQADLEEKST